MWAGLSGLFSIFFRSFTMKLSTVRLVGLASSPQIFYGIVTAHRLTDALGGAAGARPRGTRHVLLSERLQRMRGEVHLRIADDRARAPTSSGRAARHRMARMRAMSSFTLNGLVT